MAFVHSRLGETVGTVLTLIVAVALLFDAGRVFRDETVFYSKSVSASARIVSNQFTSGGRSVRWTIAYEFAATPGSDALYRGPTRSYPQAIDTAQKPGEIVSIRYRPEDPLQNALETGGPVLWSCYLTGGLGLLSLALALSLAASWSGLRR